MPVILFHAGFEIFGGGYVGVDVFFVISGYLITTIILNEMNEGRFSLVNFYERRARRILPALFFVMAVCLPFAWAWLTPRDMEEFARSVAAVSVFASNILFWRESGYFDTAAELKPLLHTWSLAVEEQYYIVFPLFLMLVWRFGKPFIIVSLVIIFVLSLGLAEWASHNKPWAAFFLLPMRGWELMLGAFCAFGLQRFSTERFRLAAQILSALGICMIAVAVFTYDAKTPMPGLYATVPTVGAALIILFANGDTLARKLLSQRYIVGVGLVSYSAYLWHQPLFAFARHRLLEPSEALMIALSLASVGLAYLSWKFVETPFRDKRRITRPRIFQSAAVCSVLLLSVGVFGHLNNGFPGRFAHVLAGDTGHTDFYEHLEKHYVDCASKEIVKQANYFGGRILRCKKSREGDPDTVLLGDSHAEQLFIGLSEALPDRNLVFYTRGDTPYVGHEKFEPIYDEILNNGREQLVLLTMHYWERVGKFRFPNDIAPEERERLHEKFRVFAKLRAPGDISADEVEQFYTELKKTVTILTEAGKQVVLIGDIPRYSIEPDVCVYQIKDTFGEVHPLCSMPIAEANAQKDTYHQTLQRLSRELGIKYIDLFPVVCNEEQCSMVRGDQVIYRDDDHFNIPGSRLAADYIVERLSEELAAE